MKLRKDVCCLLLDIDFKDDGRDYPYLRNFFTFVNGDRESLSLWDFLWFLNYEMENYKKERGIESFQEYLDNKYPPKKKHPQKRRC